MPLLKGQPSSPCILSRLIVSSIYAEKCQLFCKRVCFGDIIDLTYDYMCQDYNVQQIILWAEKNYVHDFVLAYNSLKTRHGWPS